MFQLKAVLVSAPKKLDCCRIRAGLSYQSITLGWIWTETCRSSCTPTRTTAVLQLSYFSIYYLAQRVKWKHNSPHVLARLLPYLPQSLPVYTLTVLETSFSGRLDHSARAQNSHTTYINWTLG